MIEMSSLTITLTLLVGLSICSSSSIKFGQSEEIVNTRLGLLGTDLGLSPTGDLEDDGLASFTDGRNDDLSGRVPGGSTGGASPPVEQVGGQGGGQVEGQVGSQVGGQCCCVPSNQQCADPFSQENNFIDDGLINARDNKRTKRQIQTRIVHREPVNPTVSETSCPAGMKSCCYDSGVDITALARTSGCINPHQTANQESWVEGCQNAVPQVDRTCGTRSGFSQVSGLEHAQAGPGEFPWTCLLLNQNNDFIGTCAIIPNNSTNDNTKGTVKVLTAAHKLKVLQEKDLLKVRVGEYDASGVTGLETAPHQEYTVIRILKHPQMSNTRLSNDLAILYVDREIDLRHPMVNTACLPTCQDQFSHQFSNGTGVRCWVAGWGKDEEDGSFQFIQRKVDLPIVDDSTCQNSLKAALNKQRAGSGNRFQLHRSEICAGGQVGKDACTGDGGSPLVCQSTSGRWTVVGLVAWGVGCASEVPGVYVKISAFQQWIDSN